MGLHLLPHRRLAGVARGVVGRRRQIGHVGRRVGGQDAQQVLQHPLAPLYRRRAAGLRRHRQDAALAQQPAPGVVGLAERDAAEPAAGDVRDPVVAREPLVDERVVGRQQVEHAPVLGHEAREEQLGLAAERLPQVVVEIGEPLDDGNVALEAPQGQPLAGEVGGQRRRPRVGQHPPHLALEDPRLAQAARLGEVEQLVVGAAAPQEERQPRRQLEAADGIGVSRLEARRLDLDAVDEPRIGENPLQPHLDAGLEAAAVLPAHPVEAHDGVEVRGARRPPVGAADEGRQDLLGAGVLVAGAARPADEDAAAARRVAGPGRVVGAVDTQAADVGMEGEARQPSRLDGAAQERVVQVETGREVRGEERDADGVRTGGDREPQVDGELAGAAPEPPDPQRVVPVDEGRPLAVEEDLELLAAHLAEGPGVAHVAHVHRHHPEHVLAVGGEEMLDAQPAAGAERQPLHVVVLGGVLGDAVDGLGRGGDVADGEPADAGRRRQVGLDEGRRQAQGPRLVVEPPARVVGGQQPRGVDLDRQQVPDDVGVLGAVQAVQPRRREAAHRVAVELGLEPLGQGGVGFGIGTRRAGRRHHAGPQPPNAPLEDLGVVRHAGQIDGVPHDAGVASDRRPLVVTADAVLVQQRARVRRGQGGGSSLGGGRTHGGHLRQGARRERRQAARREESSSHGASRDACFRRLYHGGWGRTMRAVSASGRSAGCSWRRGGEGWRAGLALARRAEPAYRFRSRSGEHRVRGHGFRLRGQPVSLARPVFPVRRARRGRGCYPAGTAFDRLAAWGRREASGREYVRLPPRRTKPAPEDRATP